MQGSTIRLHRVLQAAPERVYRAFIDPDAMVKWLRPNGFTRQGARNRRPGRRVVQDVVDRFDDPNLPGEMTVTVELQKVGSGTELDILQESVPR